MIKELGTIVLTVDIPDFGLHAGDLGTVVLMHKHAGYEVELGAFTGSGIGPRRTRPRSDR
jgi:hypothetical protein